MRQPKRIVVTVEAVMCDGCGKEIGDQDEFYLVTPTAKPTKLNWIPKPATELCSNCIGGKWKYIQHETTTTSHNL